MLKFPKVVIVPVLVFGAASGQPSRAAQSEPSQAADPIRCEYVVTADPGAKPTRMCLPQSHWAAREKARCRRCHAHRVPLRGRARNALRVSQNLHVGCSVG